MIGRTQDKSVADVLHTLPRGACRMVVNDVVFFHDETPLTLSSGQGGN